MYQRSRSSVVPVVHEVLPDVVGGNGFEEVSEVDDADNEWDEADESPEVGERIDATEFFTNSFLPSASPIRTGRILRGSIFRSFFVGVDSRASEEGLFKSWLGGQ